MIIIWRGWGILAPILAVVVWFLPLALTEGVLGPASYHRIAAPLATLTALLAAGAIWVVGSRLNGVPGRMFIDPSTGQRILLRRRHDLFFIPMQYWAGAMVLVAILSAFARG